MNERELPLSHHELQALADLGRETPKCQLHTYSALPMSAPNIFGQFRRLKVALGLDHAAMTSETKGRLEEPLPRKYTRKAPIAELARSLEGVCDGPLSYWERSYCLWLWPARKPR